MVYDESTIQKHMNILQISREEAIELIKEDDRIDHMKSAAEINSDLNAEKMQEKQTERKQFLNLMFPKDQRKKIQTKES